MVSEGCKSLHSIPGLRHSVRRPLPALLLLLSFCAAAQDDLDKRDKVESSGIFNVTWIDNQLSSSGQIHAEHARLLQSLGVKTVVNLAVYNEEYNGSENQWSCVIKNACGAWYVRIDPSRQVILTEPMFV